ncbi:MAG TPA: TIGR04063 family PEP-CTERM/XrtA system glycosyltransferase [Stellaceae bacterium]|nr:TIGR04063 family PEP-CTERM/XrtA system glycosyltransferase [Stellaceae bacterium]
MKILHILDHSLPLHSGYAFRTIAILQAQRARGWETAHLTTPKHNATATPVEVVDGWTIYRSPPIAPYDRVPIVREGANVLAAARRIEEVVRIERPDILHAHSPALNGLAALRAGRKLGLPVVYEVRAFWEDAAVDLGTTTEHSLRYRLSHAIESLVLRKSDAVTTICEGLRGDILARGIAADKVTVIPNAVDTAAFTDQRTIDAALRREIGLDGHVVLGFIGSWYAYEGLDLLIRALPAMLKDRPEIALLLVGGGPAEDELRRLAAALGVVQQIRFLGRVPHAEVKRYYDLVDLFVYPRHSMRLTEIVTPLKPLEAMASGRIVLASDVGGHRELIRAEDTGFLFRAGDVDALARAVIDVLAARERWPRMQQAARDFVEHERTWTASVARYQAVYDRVLGAAAKRA